MNYFLDFIPEENFLNQVDNLAIKLVPNDKLVLNMYIKQLPAMNINELIYCDMKEVGYYVSEIKKRNMKINIMLDTFCFGNKEFTIMGKEIFNTLDEIFKLNIDYVTVTNNFFFNYIKRRYSNIEIIMSEYSEINNIQKIDRYLENVNADKVKLDLKLSLNYDNMKYIKENFDVENICIDMNKVYFDNDIYKDSLNNSISHYIQESKWDKVKESIKEYLSKQDNCGNKRIYFKKEDFEELKKIGFKNFWYYYNWEEQKDSYVDEFCGYFLEHKESKNYEN